MGEMGEMPMECELGIGVADDAPEFVLMERDRAFASRHGTEVGDDPVFDELFDYASCLRGEVKELAEHLRSAAQGRCRRCGIRAIKMKGRDIPELAEACVNCSAFKWIEVLRKVARRMADDAAQRQNRKAAQEQKRRKEPIHE